MNRITPYARKSKGIAILEFTLVSTALLIVLFGIFEIGRYIYSVQMINEVTRKAARLATVCHVSDRNNIANMSSIVKSLPAGVSSSNLVISYLDKDENEVASPETNVGDIKFVRAKITNVNYTFYNVLISFSNNSNILPEFETTLPAENLGVLRYVSQSDEYTDCY